MKKHNKQQRQLGALIRFYRRHAPKTLDYMDNGSIHWGPEAWVTRMRKEKRALETRLPPEMVAWARIAK